MADIELKQGLENAMVILRDALREELEKQGHVLTGALQRSLDFQITEIPFGWKGTMLALLVRLLLRRINIHAKGCLHVRPTRILRRGSAQGL